MTRSCSTVNINIELRIIKIWDRALMTHTYNVLAVSRMLKDITNNDNFFGGKIVIFCDDPRQTLPLTPKASWLAAGGWSYVEAGDQGKLYICWKNCRRKFGRKKAASGRNEWRRL